LKILYPKPLIAVAGILGLWLFAIAAGSPKLVTEKSKIEFVGSKPSAAHKGGFKTFAVDGSIDWEKPSNSNLTIDIDATSLWSDDGGLTSHLKNRDFFNVDAYPKIRFETTKIELAGDGAATISGKLTLLDQTVEVTTPCKVELSDAGLKIGAKLTIDRTKWGMTYGQGRVNNEVDVAVTLVFAR
jgi:polyisoprenoid-binding protein YceI